MSVKRPSCEMPGGEGNNWPCTVGSMTSTTVCLEISACLSPGKPKPPRTWQGVRSFFDHPDIALSHIRLDEYVRLRYLVLACALAHMTKTERRKSKCRTSKRQ